MKKFILSTLIALNLTACHEEPEDVYKVKFVMSPTVFEEGYYCGRNCDRKDRATGAFKSEFLLNGKSTHEYFVFPRRCYGAKEYKGGDVVGGEFKLFKYSMEMELPDLSKDEKFMRKVAELCTYGKVGEKVEVKKH